MITLLQRVLNAKVEIDGQTVGQIDHGIVALIAAQQDDTPERAQRLAERILKYRLFNDDNGRMNLNVGQVDGAILAVPQFTLAADTKRGNRPGFSYAMSGQPACELFDLTVSRLKQSTLNIQTGRFGADMQVSLVNDGPVTFWVES